MPKGARRGDAKRRAQEDTTLKPAFDVSLPLEKACTPPAAWYTSPEVAARERAVIFSRSWHYAAPSAWLRAPGEFTTVSVAGESLLIVRGQDGVLRAFSNVCRHRASPVATVARGACKAFRCPYHGWTYGTDGALHVAPECEGVEDFDPRAVRLPEVAVEEAAASPMHPRRFSQMRCDIACAMAPRGWFTLTVARMWSRATGRSTSTTTSMAAITSRACTRCCIASSTTPRTAPSWVTGGTCSTAPPARLKIRATPPGWASCVPGSTPSTTGSSRTSR
ncbi:MAG: Rieske (2Fe-2S) protein [Proteobacteria bacterium]|nr:Rieske (2Fe-2S) protein [Pseudomonadota bacterium]